LSEYRFSAVVVNLLSVRLFQRRHCKGATECDVSWYQNRRNARRWRIWTRRTCTNVW